MKILNLILICVSIFTAFLNAQNNKKDSFYVANWNLENLFDTIDDPLKDDSQFLPDSPNKWNDEKFEQKLINLAKVINFMNNGCGPDILSVQEVENINVLKRLIYKLRDRDYNIIHRESPDERGIDIGLIYDRKIFDIKNVSKLHVELPDHNPTRDIIHAELIHKNCKEKIHVFVNHWPSRRGGEIRSNENRVAAAVTLKQYLDSLILESNKSKIILLGDFNDGPDNESIENILDARDFECDELPVKSFINL